jgi:hypothetical protein
VDKPIERWTAGDIASVFTMACLVACIIVGIILFIAKFKKTMDEDDNWRNPIIKKQAKIILVERISDKWNLGFTYYCTFQLEDGTRQRILIPKEGWNNFVEGDTGTLATQGTAFLSFKLDSATAPSTEQQ